MKIKFNPSVFLTLEVNECLTIREGTFYNGDISKASDGKACRPWKQTGAEIPPTQYEGIPELIFPDRRLEDLKNKCRNPGGQRKMPWCYTGRRTWSYCDIKQCGKNKWGFFILTFFLATLYV